MAVYIYIYLRFTTLKILHVKHNVIFWRRGFRQSETQKSPPTPALSESALPESVSGEGEERERGGG